MKRILFVLLLMVISFVYSNCTREETKNLSTKEKIDLFLPKNFESNIGIITESIKYGLQVKTNKSTQLEQSLVHLGIIYNLSEQSVNQVINDNRLNKLKSAGTPSTADFIDENISDQAKVFLNKLLDCFNHIEGYREFSSVVDTFYFNNFQTNALSSIYGTESIIVDSNELSAKDKTVLLVTAATLKLFITDFELLSTFVLDNFDVSLKGGFLSNLWEVTKQVVSAVVSVVVNVVVSTVTGIVAGYSEGQLMAPICGAAGAISGFFHGLESGINCNSFDFDCILENAQYGC